MQKPQILKSKPLAMTFEEQRKALGIRSDEELEAELKQLLEEKAQIEQFLQETAEKKKQIETEIHVAQFLDNILSLGKS